MTPKKIIVRSLVTPDASGYGDKIVVCSNGDMYFNDSCSACPNPTRPKTTLRWTACYAWIATTPDDAPYRWDCVENEKYGSHIIINCGGRVPTRNANVNHKGEFFATEMLIHCGFSEKWRGSAGCITVPPRLWPLFMGQFKLGETGPLYVLDHSGMTEKEAA